MKKVKKILKFFKKHHNWFFVILVATVVFFEVVSDTSSRRDQMAMLSTLNNLNTTYGVKISKPLFDDSFSSSTASLFQANLTNYGDLKQNEKENLILKFKGKTFRDNFFLASIEDESKIDSYLSEVGENLEQIEYAEKNSTFSIQSESLEKKYKASSFNFSKFIGEKNVRVAVVDTGVDVSNYFVKERLFQNPGEKVLGGDEDKNGFKDDFNGFNFHSNDGEVQDLNGHGTHVSGIYLLNPKVEILPLKVTDSEGNSRLSDILESLRYLDSDLEVDILNFSIGTFSDSKLLENSIEKIKEKGTFILASAGNYSSDKPFYPAALAGVYGVCSTNKKGVKLNNSNFGDWLSLCAYGENVYSFSLNNSFEEKTGTSQAAPVFGLFLSFLLSYGEESPQVLIEKFSNSAYLDSETQLKNIDFNSLLAYLDSKQQIKKVFKDLNYNSPEGRAVDFLVKKGIFSDEKENFYPDQNLTRAELLKVLVASTGFEKSNVKNIRLPFSDLKKGEWYYPFFQFAYRDGIISGYSDLTVKPGNPVTRAEFLKIFSKIYSLEEFGDDSFFDFSSKDWFFSYTGNVSRYNLFPYSSLKLTPSKNLTRSEFALAVSNFLKSKTSGQITKK